MDCLEHQTILEVFSKTEFFLKKTNNLNMIFPCQPKEIEQGNREYKISLDYSDKKPNVLNSILEKKATQMNYRLLEGGGKAIYFIGVEDNGISSGIQFNELFKSLIYFTKIIKLSQAVYFKIRIYKGINGYIATIRVSKIFKNNHLLLDF